MLISSEFHQVDVFFIMRSIVERKLIFAKGLSMNKITMKGHWNEWRGKAKKQWGKLTDNDIKQVEGDYDQLVGKVQQRYGKSKEEAEKEVDSFVNDCNC